MPYTIAVMRTIATPVEATMLGPGFSPLGRAFSFASSYEAAVHELRIRSGLSAVERLLGSEPQQSATMMEISHAFSSYESIFQGRNFHESEPLSPVPDQMEKKRVAEMAYYFWEDRGKPFGSPDEDWFRAERELRRTAEKFMEQSA